MKKRYTIPEYVRANNGKVNKDTQNSYAYYDNNPPQYNSFFRSFETSENPFIKVSKTMNSRSNRAEFHIREDILTIGENTPRILD